MFISKIKNIIKAIFIKEETFSCIVFDGKTMSYPQLTLKQIDNIKSKDEYRDWIVTIDENRAT